MPSVKLTTRVQADDFIRGLAFMGTGGGGRPEAGRENLYPHIDKGEPLGWTDLAELPDDGYACCAFTMGSTAPRPPGFQEGQQWPEYGTRAPGTALPVAVRELEEYTGRRVSVLFPLELGAANTTGPLHCAAELGLKVADGEGCGRAVPEASQITPALAGYTIWPAAISDEWGNILILKRASSLDIAEAIGKAISVISKTPDPHVFCGMACYLMPVAEMKRLIVPGTLSKAYTLGQGIRHARERGQDPVSVAAQLADGWVVFRGTVTKREWQNCKGYQIGTTEITGVGSYSGHRMRIWFKNEHHVSWVDDEPFITSPDLLTVVDAATAEPITNTYLAEGNDVAVVGIAAPPQLRTRAAISVLGPKHFGFDLPYRPIESLVR